MTKTEYARYLQSDHWRATRKEAMENGQSTCKNCAMPRWLAQIAYDQDLHVHHVTYERLGAEESDDLELLCRRCHDIETFGRSDLREISTATCECCGAGHWDKYCDYCQSCLGLINGGGDPTVMSSTFIRCDGCGKRSMGDKCRDCGTEAADHEKQALWTRVLMRIVSDVGQDRVVDELSAIEEMERHDVLFVEVEMDGEIRG